MSLHSFVSCPWSSVYRLSLYVTYSSLYASLASSLLFAFFASLAFESSCECWILQASSLHYSNLLIVCYMWQKAASMEYTMRIELNTKSYSETSLFTITPQRRAPFLTMCPRYFTAEFPIFLRQILYDFYSVKNFLIYRLLSHWHSKLLSLELHPFCFNTFLYLITESSRFCCPNGGATSHTRSAIFSWFILLFFINLLCFYELS